jgi:hypothetical protein
MTAEISNTDEDDLDIQWIEDFEIDEEKYSMFYLDKVEEITASILYINKKKQIEKISEKKIKLEKKNEIQRNELITMIKQNEKMDKRKYKVLSILVYNFTLHGDELKNFLKDSKKYDFMTNLKNIDSYQLEPTIGCMHDVNNLFLLFYEEDATDATDATNAAKTSRQTKRVKFNLMQGKTRRKR